MDLSIHRRMIAILFFPVISFLWILGWGLYSIGDESRSQRAIQRVDDYIYIVTAMYEEAVITSKS